MKEHQASWQALGQCDASLLSEPEEFCLLDLAVNDANLMDQIKQIREKKAHLESLRKQGQALWNRRNHLSAPSTPQEKALAQRIRGITEEQLMIFHPQALKSVVGELKDFLHSCDQKIQDLQNQKQNIGNELFHREKRTKAAATLLSHILNAKQYGFDTASLLPFAKPTLESQNSDDQAIERQVPNLTALPQASPPPLTMLDRAICFYQGNDLIHRDGHFLVVDLVDVREKDVAHCRAQIKQAEVSNLLASVSEGTIVRAKLDNNNQLIADPKGSIRLYKEKVTDVILSNDRVDFGMRQRLVAKDGKISRQNKEYKKQAVHPRMTDERWRSAAVDSAENMLLRKELYKKAMCGETESITFNDLTNLFAHLDAVDANDIAQLPGSYLSDPRYMASRDLCEHIRPALEPSILTRTARQRSKELTDEKYQWNEDCSRVKKIREIYQTLENQIKLANQFLKDLAASKTSTQSKFNFFRKQMEGLKSKETAMRDDLLEAARPILDTDHTDKEAHIYIERHEDDLADALHRFASSAEDLKNQTIQLSIATDSPAVQQKIQKRSWWDFRSKPSDAERLFEQLKDVVINSMQTPVKLPLLIREIYKGTSFIPSMLKTIDSYETLTTGCMRQEAVRLKRLYAQQQELGHRGAKFFFTPSQLQNSPAAENR